MPCLRSGSLKRCQREYAGGSDNKKGLHFCSPFLVLRYMAPPAGLEPATH